MVTGLAWEEGGGRREGRERNHQAVRVCVCVCVCVEE